VSVVKKFGSQNGLASVLRLILWFLLATRRVKGRLAFFAQRAQGVRIGGCANVAFISTFLTIGL